MLIVVQDRDKIIHTKKRATLFTLPAIHNDMLLGINLFYGDPYTSNPKSKSFLGTFDSALDALHEMQKIEACIAPIYFVSGYSSDVPESILEKMLEGNDCEMG